jgi:adenylate cyclase
LIGIDEEGTLAQLKALRKTIFDPKIAEHHGRIVKNTGDGALELGSVVDAVRCAVDILAQVLQRRKAPWRDRQQTADFAAKPRWRNQPATVIRGAKL